MSQLVQQIPGLLTADECQNLIELSERFGFLKQRFGSSYPAEIRHRVAIDDASIAGRLWALLEPQLRPVASYVNQTVRRRIDVDVDDYAFCGVNERLRFYKYHEGERFTPHEDIAFEKSDRERSLLSVIVYLNDDFEGGQTRFAEVEVQAQAGAAIVFVHELVHEGLAVAGGIKRVLRTDVMGQQTVG